MKHNKNPEFAVFLQKLKLKRIFNQEHDMRPLRNWLILATTTLILSPFVTHGQQSKKIILAGYKMHPAVGTSGSGIFTVTLDGDTLRVQGDFSKLMSNYTGAYIMVGKPGDKGNVLYTLEVKPNEQKTGGKLKAKDNTFVLNEAQKALLRQGNLSFIVSSAEHQNGEIVAPIPAMGKKK